ncbi:MAG: hypothetical protein K9H49_18695 [Bacteroidales bacterium]|nr:hypothetical protein [Bacteroidales bacterium]MCF8391646.1 hypothetical protein [Bacteroidales bacterium]
MKKLIFTFLFFISYTVLIFGQNNEAISIYDEKSDTLTTTDKIKRLQYNTSIGTSFFYSGAYGSGNEFFAAPELSYGLTPRLSLHGGVMFSYTSFFGLQNGTEEGGAPMRAFPGMSIYGAANYQLNERVSFYGTGIRHMSTFIPGEKQNFVNPGYYSYSFGSTYKIGKNISIGASIHVRDRNTYYSPFSFPSSGGNYSPFYW